MTNLERALRRADSSGEGSSTNGPRQTSFIFNSGWASDLGASAVFEQASGAFEELCLLDKRFIKFRSSLFDVNSAAQGAGQFDRATMDTEQCGVLTALVAHFCRLLSPHFLKRAAHWCIEWLIKRYSSQVYDVDALMGCALLYHDTKLFVRLCCVCDLGSENSLWYFLRSAQENGQPVSRQRLVRQCLRDPTLLDFVLSLPSGRVNFLPDLSFATSILVESLKIEIKRDAHSLSSAAMRFALHGLQRGAGIDRHASALIVLSQLCLAFRLQVHGLTTIVEAICDNVDLSLQRSGVALSCLALVCKTQGGDIFSRKALSALSQWEGLVSGLRAISGGTIGEGDSPTASYPPALSSLCMSLFDFLVYRSARHPALAVIYSRIVREVYVPDQVIRGVLMSVLKEVDALQKNRHNGVTFQSREQVLREILSATCNSTKSVNIAREIVLKAHDSSPHLLKFVASAVNDSAMQIVFAAENSAKSNTEVFVTLQRALRSPKGVIRSRACVELHHLIRTGIASAQGISAFCSRSLIERLNDDNFSVVAAAAGDPFTDHMSPSFSSLVSCFSGESPRELFFSIICSIQKQIDASHVVSKGLDPGSHEMTEAMRNSHERCIWLLCNPLIDKFPEMLKAVVVFLITFPFNDVDKRLRSVTFHALSARNNVHERVSGHAALRGVFDALFHRSRAEEIATSPEIITPEVIEELITSEMAKCISLPGQSAHLNDIYEIYEELLLPNAFIGYDDPSPRSRRALLMSLKCIHHIVRARTCLDKDMFRSVLRLIVLSVKSIEDLHYDVTARDSGVDELLPLAHSALELLCTKNTVPKELVHQFFSISPTFTCNETTLAQLLKYTDFEDLVAMGLEIAKNFNSDIEVGISGLRGVLRIHSVDYRKATSSSLRSVLRLILIFLMHDESQIRNKVCVLLKEFRELVHKIEDGVTKTNFGPVGTIVWHICQHRKELISESLSMPVICSRLIQERSPGDYSDHPPGQSLEIARVFIDFVSEIDIHSGKLCSLMNGADGNIVANSRTGAISLMSRIFRTLRNGINDYKGKGNARNFWADTDNANLLNSMCGLIRIVFKQESNLVFENDETGVKLLMSLISEFPILYRSVGNADIRGDLADPSLIAIECTPAVFNSASMKCKCDIFFSLGIVLSPDYKDSSRKSYATICLRRLDLDIDFILFLGRQRPSSRMNPSDLNSSISNDTNVLIMVLETIVHRDLTQPIIKEGNRILFEELFSQLGEQTKYFHKNVTTSSGDLSLWERLAFAFVSIIKKIFESKSSEYSFRDSIDAMSAVYFFLIISKCTKKLEVKSDAILISSQLKFTIPERTVQEFFSIVVDLMQENAGVQMLRSSIIALLSSILPRFLIIIDSDRYNESAAHKPFLRMFVTVDSLDRRTQRMFISRYLNSQPSNDSGNILKCIFYAIFRELPGGNAEIDVPLQVFYRIANFSSVSIISESVLAIAVDIHEKKIQNGHFHCVTFLARFCASLFSSKSFLKRWTKITENNFSEKIIHNFQELMIAFFMLSEREDLDDLELGQMTYIEKVLDVINALLPGSDFLSMFGNRVSDETNTFTPFRSYYFSDNELRYSKIAEKLLNFLLTRLSTDVVARSRSPSASDIRELYFSFRSYYTILPCISAMLTSDATFKTIQNCLLATTYLAQAHDILFNVDNFTDDTEQILNSSITMLTDNLPAISSCVDTFISGDFCAQDLVLASNALLANASICRTCGQRSLLHLAASLPVFINLVDVVLDSNFASNNIIIHSTDSQENDEIYGTESFLKSYLLTVEIWFLHLGALLTPYLVDLLKTVSTCILNGRSRLFFAAGENALKCAGTHISPRVLLRPAFDAFSRIFEDKTKFIRYDRHGFIQFVGLFFTMLQSTISAMSTSEVDTYKKYIFMASLRPLSDSLMWSGISGAKNARTSIVQTLISLVLKMSETQFRPSFLHMVQWAELPPESFVASNAIKHPLRCCALLEVINSVVEKLKSVFIPYFAYLIEPFVAILDALGYGIAGKLLTLRRLVVKSLHLCFSFDSPGSFIDIFRFEKLKDRVVSLLHLEGAAMLEAFSRSGRVKNVDPTRSEDLTAAHDTIKMLAAMAYACGSEVLQKPLNHSILVNTRSEDASTRLMALLSCSEIASRLGDDFLPLIPETLPFLAETIEDVDPSVEKATKNLLLLLEEQSGEDLQHFLA